MADNDEGAVHGTTEAGIAGTHDPPSTPQLRVGSATADELNTIILRLAPIACFQVEDVRFGFNTSFLLSDPTDEKKDIRAELKLLANLRQANPECPLSVWGHADPVGDDEYNKQLSGRRATVFYALLISKSEPAEAVTLWKSVAKDEHWGADQRQTMQAFTGLPAGTSDDALMQAYMQALYPPELTLKKTDFLAQGTGKKGKGDYQGCSAFNPRLIFSEQKNNAFNKDPDKTARNDANAINRRVMVLLFQKGSKIDPTKWPCPAATESTTDCRKRFWTRDAQSSETGDQRRKRRLPDQDRVFEDKKDTFACRFYQRLIDTSPCEGAATLVKIRLFDPQARPLPFAPCLVTETGGKPKPLRATGANPGGSPPLQAGDEDAYVSFGVKTVPTTVNVKWSRPKPKETAKDDPIVFTDTQNVVNSYKYEFEMDVNIDISDADQQAASTPRLKNLGYVKGPKPDQLTIDVDSFQKDYKQKFPDIVQDGTLNQPTMDAIQSAHDNANPVLKAGSEIPVKR